MTSITENFKTIQKEVGKINPQATLLAVSKTFPNEALLEAARAGALAFGENYAQEGCDKVDWFKTHCPQCNITWHFIGPLQSNKTRPVAERFDWVQSIDRVKIAQRLNDQRPESLLPLNVLIEVNIDGEDTKSGVAPEHVRALCLAISKMSRLKLRGLMTIPAPKATKEEEKETFLSMKALYDSLKEEFHFDTLSMGMSADYVEALKAGSTMVRVGSKIFGARTYTH